MLKIGSKAPDFRLYDNNGNLVRLSNHKNKTIVLYFYPKDLTSGCIKEACSFRDNLNNFNKKDVIVFGISLDNQRMHEKFSSKYNLNFPLLADLDVKISKAYGVYGKKNLYGREFYGIKRTTFIIKNGKIKYIFEKVKPEGHAKEVLQALNKV